MCGTRVGRQAGRQLAWAHTSRGRLTPSYTKLTPSERLYPGGKVAGVPAVKLAPTETLPSGPLSAFLPYGAARVVSSARWWPQCSACWGAASRMCAVCALCVHCTCTVCAVCALCARCARRSVYWDATRRCWWPLRVRIRFGGGFSRQCGPQLLVGAEANARLGGREQQRRSEAGEEREGTGGAHGVA